MKPTDPVEKIHAYARKMAEHTLANWRRMERKDPEICKLGIALDGEEPGTIDVLLLEFPWKIFEEISVEQLTAVICAAIRGQAGEVPAATVH